MQCSYCRYEFTLSEVQSGAECPRCAETASRRSAEKVYAKPQEVAVVDFQMSFNSMVWFMVKWVIASIPALIILFLIGTALTLFFGTFISAITKL